MNTTVLCTVVLTGEPSSRRNPWVLMRNDGLRCFPQISYNAGTVLFHRCEIQQALTCENCSRSSLWSKRGPTMRLIIAILVPCGLCQGFVFPGLLLRDSVNGAGRMRRESPSTFLSQGIYCINNCNMNVLLSRSCITDPKRCDPIVLREIMRERSALLVGYSSVFPLERHFNTGVAVMRDS